MSLVTQLGNGYSLRTNPADYLSEDTTYTLISADKYHMTIGTQSQAEELARAILAALGEPVKSKSDRSELDAILQARFAIIRFDPDPDLVRTWGIAGNAADAIRFEQELSSLPFAVYESIAYVGPKPEPAERKVVRL